MKRRDYLQKAADALGQVIANLQHAGENELASWISSNHEENIDDLLNAEPRGPDTDDAYELSRERGQ